MALIATAPLLQRRVAVPIPTPAASGALRVPAAASAGFVRALADSRSPGIAQYLLLHPAARPAAMAAATRTMVDEDHGTGRATVALHPDLAADSGGRVTVVLVAAGSAPLRWSITRTAVRPDHRQYEQTVGAQEVVLLPGVPATASVRYDGAAPRTLLVEAGDGVRWDAVVAFTD